MGSGWPRRSGSPMPSAWAGRWPSGWSTADRRSTSTSATSNRFEAASAVAVVHPRPRHPELRRGLRHRPPAPADGGAAAAADVTVLRAGTGARCVLPRGWRLGTATLVRRERGAARPVRHPRSERLGSPLLASDRRRRGPCDSRRRGDLRRHAPQADRGRRIGRRGVPRSTHHEPRRPSASGRSCTACCWTTAVEFAAT